MTRSNRFSYFFLAVAFILLFVCLSQIASAATGTAAISLTRPTQFADGTPLTAAQITGYQVDCTFTPTGGVATACTMNGSPLPGGTASGGSVSITYPVVGGEACFRLRTMVGPTNPSPGTQPPVCKALPAIAPNDPTNVTITITVALNITSDSPIRVAVAEPVVTRSP